MTTSPTIREAIARWFHSGHCHHPGCDGTPEEWDFEDADNLTASPAFIEALRQGAERAWEEGFIVGHARGMGLPTSPNPYSV